MRARMEQQLAPLHEVVEHYRDRDALTTIDGLQPIDRVTGALLGALGMPASAGGR